MNKICIFNALPLTALGVAHLLESQFNLVCENMGRFDETNPRYTDADCLIVSTEQGFADQIILGFRNHNPKIRVIVLGEKEDHREAMPYLKLGVEAYVSKTMSLEQLMDVFKKSIMDGQRYVSQMLADSIIYDYILFDQNKDIQQLSSRQRQIAEMIAKGMRTKDIAEELDLKVTTISTQKGTIYRKLGVRNSVELKGVIQGQMVG